MMPRTSFRRPLDAFQPSDAIYLRVPHSGAAIGCTVDQAVERLATNVALSPRHAGPSSNTGLNTSIPFHLSIDYCTLVFSAEKGDICGQSTRTIVDWLFGHDSGLYPTELRSKFWQFYKLSAYINDAEGNCVGRIGRGGNGDTWCVSLTGAGCQRVLNWHWVKVQAGYLDAHISRLDIALDDFGAVLLGDIRQINELARTGGFAPVGCGKPPVTSFHDDHGSGKGSTVYVGLKGRKQLCIYEKGKQLGDPESPWVRVELRLWAADSVVPLDALTRPHEVMRGAYALLADRVPMCDEASRPEKKAREVSAHAVAACRFLREQCGPLLNLMWQCLGDQAVEFFREEIFRNTLPSRFKGSGLDHESLLGVLRYQLGFEVPPPF